MFRKRTTDAYERGQALWFMLPESERTAKRVLEELIRDNFKVSKATVCRWAKQWKRAQIEALELILGPSKSIEAAQLDDPPDIPEWIRKALPERIWVVAQGKGLDRVERAICLLSDALGARATQLAQDDRSLFVASQALLAMASAMYQVVNGRALTAIAHRSFCEGDLAAAKGKKAEAEAQTAAEFAKRRSSASQ
jgi:hypothetical protein